MKQSGMPTLPLKESPGEIFKRIYYRLYSNSEVIRAESILANISLLLVVYFDLISDKEGKKTLSEFLDGEIKGKDLLKNVNKRSPELLQENDVFAIGDDLLRSLLDDLDKLDPDSSSHVFGEAFQALIGPRLRGDKGQFFTPRALIQSIVSMCEFKDGFKIVDPACGTGGFLTEAALYAKKMNIKSLQISGSDKDKDLAKFAMASMRIISDQKMPDIHSRNSLNIEEWALGSYDLVLTNPPFGAKIGIDDPAILNQYDLAHIPAEGDVAKIGTGRKAISQDPQILFIELCVRLLREGGTMAIVLPEGVFGNKQSAFVWKWLEKQGSIEALIDCPRTTFQPGTDTKTNVLFFRKGGKQSKKIKVAVATQCGHDRRGRVQNAAGDAIRDDFAILAKSFRSTKSPDWTDSEIPSDLYFVPRYMRLKSNMKNLDFGIAQGCELVSFGDLVSQQLLSINKGHEVGSEAYGSGDIPFVRTSDITNFEIRSDSANGVSQDIYELYAKQQKLSEGDVLLVVDGRYRIGAAAILTNRNLRIVAQSHLRIVKSLNHEVIDPYSLLFALTLPAVREQMRDLVFVQSTLGTVAPRLKELVIPLMTKQGNWTPAISRFKEVLIERDLLLARLANETTTEVEL
jgi:type I restriction enzyme M protein